MREIRLSGSEGGGAKPIVTPYPYTIMRFVRHPEISAVRFTDCIGAKRFVPSDKSLGYFQSSASRTADHNDDIHSGD
jgi:hypothetical protein